MKAVTGYRMFSLHAFDNAVYSRIDRIVQA